METKLRNLEEQIQLLLAAQAPKSIIQKTLEEDHETLEDGLTRVQNMFMAETREASLKQTSAALEEIKATKRVTWSSFASVAQINSNALNNELSSRPMSPASSCTSGSDFVDPSITEQVNKALDWARSRRNLQ